MNHGARGDAGLGRTPSDLGRYAALRKTPAGRTSLRDAFRMPPATVLRVAILSEPLHRGVEESPRSRAVCRTAVTQSGLTSCAYATR
jgi:hypothetical protein